MKTPDTKTIQAIGGIADISSTIAALYVSLKVYKATSSIWKAVLAFLGIGCVLVVVLAVVLKAVSGPNDLDDTDSPTL